MLLIGACLALALAAIYTISRMRRLHVREGPREIPLVTWMLIGATFALALSLVMLSAWQLVSTSADTVTAFSNSEPPTIG